MARTEKVKTIDKMVLNLIPWADLPDIICFRNCITDDMFSPYYENIPIFYCKKNKKQESKYQIRNRKLKPPQKWRF